MNFDKNFKKPLAQSQKPQYAIQNKKSNRCFVYRKSIDKIVSVSCALTLWTWVQNQTVEEISLKALINYHYPEDVSIVTLPRQSVTVLLEGPQVLLKGMKDTSLEIHVDASDASKGTTSYEFSETSISNLPSGFRVLRISPPSIDMV